MGIAKKYFSPMASIFFVTLASTLAMTGQTLYLHDQQVSSNVIGWLSAAYFTGFVVATLNMERYILKVSHIRAFAVFSSIFSVLLISQGLFTHPLAWGVIRFGAGICNSALFIIIESWMLSAGDKKNRSLALSMYMMVYYASQAMAQFFILIGTASILKLFAVSAAFAALAVVPVANTRIPGPEFSEPSYIKLGHFFKHSPSGFVGSFLAGMLVSAIYTFQPAVIASQVGDQLMAVAVLMAATTCGGMILQYPIGLLSNLIDRRVVLLFLFIIVTLLAVLALCLDMGKFWILILFIFGAVALTVYPISISHSCDALPDNCLVAATQALVLINSVGFIIGPIIAGYILSFGSLKTHYIGYLLLLSIPSTIFFAMRWYYGKTIKLEDRHDFIAMARTTPIAAEIDPRSTESP